MESKVEKLKQSKVRLNISVSPKEMIHHFEHAYSHLAESVKLDGFRPGKAPKALTENAIGVTRILSDALDMAINAAYVEALKEHDINPISSPNIKINKYPLYGQTEEEVKNNLEFEMEVMVFPEVKIGDYSKIKIEKPKVEAAKKADVDKIIDNLRKQKANFNPLERAAKMGDMAEINFEGSIKGVRIDQMCSKNHPVVLGEKTLIPGFEEEIVGMKKGESKTFKIKFPKDYHAEFAGKDAEFKVDLLELKEVVLPEVDKTFAEAFGLKNEKELIAAIEKNLGVELEKKANDELELKILDKMLPLVKAEIPDELIEKEIDRMIGAYENQVKGMGLSFDDYLKGLKKTLADMRKDMRQTAEKNVKVGLMLGRIIEDLKLDRNDPEAGKKAIAHLVATLTK